MAFLDVIDGPLSGHRFDVANRNVMVGRDPSCAVPIPDERISRRHLQVAYDDQRGVHLAIDVGSSNGVTVNGVRLVRGAERILDDGDEIAIGRSRLRFSSPVSKRADALGS